MQKNLLLTAALVFSLFISGCGGGGSTASVIASAPDVLTVSDIFKHTLNITASKGTSSATFHTYSGTTRNDWNSNPQDSSVKLGTWSVSNGTVTFFDTNNNPVKTITGIQKVFTDQTRTSLVYWLVTAIDGTPPQSATTAPRFNCRMYVDTKAAFSAYTTSTAARIGLMGGAVQKTQLATPFSNVSTVAGVTGSSGFINYSSAANTRPALFGTPVGITTMDGTTFFVLDNANNSIRKLSPGTNGIMTVTTLKTSGGVAITFNSPSDITTDGTNLYVTDTYNYVIKKISPDNSSPGTWISAILSGTGVSGAIDGPGNNPSATGVVATAGTARFAVPIGITTDGTNLYVTDDQAIRKVDIVTGNVTTLAGSPGTGGWTDAIGTAARFNQPQRITTDGTNLYVADNRNYVIRKIVIATGAVTTIAGTAGVYGTNNPADPNNNPTVSTGDAAHFNGPVGITTDGTNLYVTDWGPVVYGNPVRGQVIFRIVLANPTNPASQYSGPVTRIAGTQDTIATSTNQTTSRPSAGSALFYCPIGITTDGTSLFVADSRNFTIRRIK
jgi:hypothetical protein